MLWKSCGSLWKSLPLNILGGIAYSVSVQGRLYDPRGRHG